MSVNYVDLHIHALFGVDDGARDAGEMLRMLDMAYAAGTRTLCLTPHYHPGYFGDNQAAAEARFALLREKVAERYPDLALYSGNELRYSPGCAAWLEEGLCRTLGGGAYVLVDFAADAAQRAILSGLDELLGSGYLPVLAHVERYRSLRGERKLLQRLRSRGVVMQVDADSVLGDFGLGTRLWAGQLLKHRLVDVIASDAHGSQSRTPELDRCFRSVQKNYGNAYAESLFRDTPGRLLQDQDEKGMDTSYGW